MLARENSAYVNRFYHNQKKQHVVKVLPGGVYCTDQPEIISTGLGSCVAACIWDPYAHVGGMNHFLLPIAHSTEHHHWSHDDVVSTASRYGSYAMEMLINQLISLGAERVHMRMKLFGGAQMLGRKSAIGEKNVDFILRYAKQERFEIDAYDLGGLEPRKILFDPLTGKAWLKRIPFAEISHLKHEEDHYAQQVEIESHKPADDVELF
ncbi:MULTISPECIES: chemotaxis protein CheD [Vibrio]|uniref:chemotaxis protein CheD n=1 Tax=Vibrio TaxID=662 RepID=UPI001FCBF995|nr:MULTISPECIES: chemotaxis protein CheD [Vibrio]